MSRLLEPHTFQTVRGVVPGSAEPGDYVGDRHRRGQDRCARGLDPASSLAYFSRQQHQTQRVDTQLLQRNMERNVLLPCEATHELLDPGRDVVVRTANLRGRLLRHLLQSPQINLVVE